METRPTKALGEWILVRGGNREYTTPSGIVMDNRNIQRCIRAEVLSLGSEAAAKRPDIQVGGTVVVPEFCGVVDDEHTHTMFVRYFELMAVE